LETGGIDCVGANGGACACCQSTEVCFQVPSRDDRSIGFCCPNNGDVWCQRPESIFELTGSQPFCCNPQKAIEKGVRIGLVEGGLSFLIFIVIVAQVIRKRKLSSSGAFRQNIFVFAFGIIGGLISVIGEMLIWMGAFGSPFEIHLFTVGLLVIYIFVLRTLFFNLIFTIRKGIVSFSFWGCFACDALVLVFSFAFFIIFITAFKPLSPHCHDYPDVTSGNLPSVIPRTCESIKYVTVGLLLICLSLTHQISTSLYFYHKLSKSHLEYETVRVVSSTSSSPPPSVAQSTSYVRMN